MFNFFKKKSYNPNEVMLGGLTANQKMSAINLLCLIARSDGMFTKREIEYMNTCYLGYSLEQCSSYLNLSGNDGMLNDLKQLSSSQKDYLLVTAFELMLCDGKINETEKNVFEWAFENLGYTQDGMIEVMEKAMLLKRKFNSGRN